MEKNAHAEADGGEAAPELTAGIFGEPLGRFELDDNSLLYQHVDPMKADLVITESHCNRVLAVDLEPSIS